ncbi:MAG: hypothetical protein GY761_17790, partial [Hyphomicrobiales bacterium]|nr:hypothetical protein [Hyphomicrobiales bacterium]
MQGDKSITGNSDTVKFNKNYADNFLDQEIQGTKISTVGSMPTKLLKTLAKLGIAGAVIALSFSGANAAQAQTSEGYDNENPNDANRTFVSDLIGEALSELAGLVAGALTGVVSFGLAAIPTAIAVAEAGLEFGKYLGGLFYDNFTNMGNAIAESLAPIFSSIAESATDLATVIYNILSDVADVMSDLVFGREGLFGLEGPLFGDDGPLQFASRWLGDNELLSDSGEWAYDGFDVLLEGTDADDVLIHDGWGEARGGKGDDILIGWQSEYKAKGDPLFEEEGSPLAIKEERLTLDGGEGDDWVLTLGGTGAILVGGEGRDFLFNTSFKGQMYGDTIDGVGQSASGTEDSDVFWYWPSTFIMDAQPNDILQMFGW